MLPEQNDRLLEAFSNLSLLSNFIEEYEELFNKFPEYSFECAMCTVKFTKTGDTFVLPDDIHASKSYEWINRLRYNISQGNYAKAGMAMTY